MGKSILMSIKPKWVAKILNGEKTIEVRKKFPKDYVGWVYIYCTKAKPYLIPKSERDRAFWEERKLDIGTALNGKVVGRFWCDKVDTIEFSETDYQWGGIILESSNEEFDDYDNFEKQSCLVFDEAAFYIGLGKVGYAIHISKLEVFDKPKELKEFKVKKAPQSYMFVEE